ncbi:MAG: LPP20 family lipoprotein, partial [Treponema sp.]|nr:LPP20 family lipoprotein [Treponema sp.]
MKQNILKCALWGILFALAAAQAGAQAQPAWTNNGASPRFPAQTHLAAVGRGNSQQNADADAIAGIARIFSVSARVSTQLAESYREIVRNGVARSFGQTDMLNVIELATDVENLVAVSIGERWNDGRGNFVALAVMDKSAAILLYEERIRANQAVIRGLTTMSASERNTFDGFARYRVAAVFADMNVAIGEMLFVLGHVPW